ncbi:PREDICTED: patatin-like phospholipase domain-containing protein 1 [Chaetura pelagica]|uniref:patatin-like phospholipase domain-containing protein 1 n=1 Tax=Chaetura pelagica TaxID=8897 RepID=UPI000523943F|nr:PREDICTED: patatin-like phospholipase domain-containing protein 1 [Chaetura pelagica]
MYEAGVVKALKDLSPAILKSAARIYGASSGSIIATLAVCECDTDEVKKYFYSALPRSFWGFVPGGRMIQFLKDTLEKYLPPNAHQLATGKLHIILTRLRDWRCMVVSEFASREELIQAITCSCFIPLYFGLIPPTFRGVRYVDGELAMWQADFLSPSTITMSGLAGEYDICPREGPAAFITFQISDCILLISKRNFCRLQCLLCLPKHEVLEQMYLHGYQDGVSFLRRLGKFDINYADEDFMLSLANELYQKGEETLKLKLEARVLHSRSTDPEDVTAENPGTIWAADEEEAPQHLLHQQKGPLQPQKSILGAKGSSGVTSCSEERTTNLQLDTKMH